nr:uncharacterized protein LOC124805912 [Hydra vulgaris]
MAVVSRQSIFQNANKSMDSDVLETIDGHIDTVKKYKLLISCYESPTARTFFARFINNLNSFCKRYDCVTIINNQEFFAVTNQVTKPDDQDTQVEDDVAETGAR